MRDCIAHYHYNSHSVYTCIRIVLLSNAEMVVKEHAMVTKFGPLLEI